MNLVRRVPIVAAVPGHRLPSWERFVWRYPEWWSLGLSAIAWLLLIVSTGSGMGHQRALHHQPDHPMAASLSGAVYRWLAETASWQLMVVAMMVPLVLVSIRTTATRSLRVRRTRGVWGFLIGYLGSWLVIGAVCLTLLVALNLGAWSPAPVFAAIGFSVAAAWQLAPLKRRALRGCHRTAPLAPRGWKADCDCMRYGWMIGLRCIVSCWAMMLACLLAGHSLAAMVSVTIIAVAERYGLRPNFRLTAAALAGLALISAATAFH
jgi:predicted metal-binding membrane protein